jgi:hypothetical protein
MSRDSDNDVIRGAVLEAMGKHCGAAALDTLIGWCAPAKPFGCRRAAAQGLSEIFKKEDLSEDDKTRAVEAVTGCLKHGSRRLQVAALDTLGELGLRPIRLA